jgi:hypothetical protein
MAGQAKRGQVTFSAAPSAIYWDLDGTGTFSKGKKRASPHFSNDHNLSAIRKRIVRKRINPLLHVIKD